MSTITPGGAVLKYGETNTLRFEFPDSWDSSEITGVEISVTDESGAVMDTDDATIYTATTLEGAAAAHATDVKLNAQAGDWYQGERILIGDDGEILETREVV